MMDTYTCSTWTCIVLHRGQRSPFKLIVDHGWRWDYRSTDNTSEIDTANVDDISSASEAVWRECLMHDPGGRKMWGGSGRRVEGCMDIEAHCVLEHSIRHLTDLTTYEFAFTMSRAKRLNCACLNYTVEISRSYKVTDNGRANGDRRLLPPITKI